MLFDLISGQKMLEKGVSELLVVQFIADGFQKIPAVNFKNKIAFTTIYFHKYFAKKSKLNI